MKPGEGYEYGLDMTTGMWVCEKNITVILVRTQEDGGFTAYDASHVEHVGRFRPEDGLPMWRTLDEDALEPGWHRWNYNLNRDLGLTWACWSESERFFETTITGWKVVSRRPGIGAARAEDTSSETGESVCAGGGVYCSFSTRGSGAGNKRRRSGASGGSGAGKKKGGTYWSWPTGTSGSGKKRRSHARGHGGSGKEPGKGGFRGW